MESRKEIYHCLDGADIVIVVAGLGGGTGTGGAPVIAEIARDIGILTIGVISLPFRCEGPRRMRQAEEGLKEIKRLVDTIIVIPYQRLLSVDDKKRTLKEVFKKTDEVLLNTVRRISDRFNGK